MQIECVAIASETFKQSADLVSHLGNIVFGQAPNGDCRKFMLISR